MRELFTIFGNPVNHSKSPLMHNLAFRGLNYSGCYGRYRLEDGSKLRDKFFELNLTGANITVPHKEIAFEICDELDEFAKRVGAVNTIVRRGDKLYGYNSDALGFLKAIEEFKDIKRVLFLGAGGTAKSTSTILKDAGYEVTILNKSAKRLEQYPNFKTYTFNNFKKDKEYDLIVNMTSAGLKDDSLPSPIDILESVISSAKASIDVIYGKETPFLKFAKKHNISTKDGSDMLLYQGIIAFEKFTNNQFTFKQIERYMKKAFYI